MNHAKISVEFFPPQTAEAKARLGKTLLALSPLAPAYFSVTHGAGGGAREGTLDAVGAIMDQGHEGAPHLSCIGASRASIIESLDEFTARGITRIVALRGDLPSGQGGAGELSHASDLVGLIRAHSGDSFHIHVAAYPETHPQATSPRQDLLAFERKMKAGADEAITQYFYNADAYFHFVDQAAKLGIIQPIVPGIMPIANFTQLARFSDRCGAEIPRWIRLKLASFGDDTASIQSFGVDVVASMCERLLKGGAPGLHFYSMNQAELILAIRARLS